MLAVNQANAASALQEILQNGELKIGTTEDWNPMSVIDPATNSYKGCDIDIMTELVRDLGVGLEFVATSRKTLVNGVVSGIYHMTDSTSISSIRMKVFGFSFSHIAVEVRSFTTSDKLLRSNGWDSINKADVKVSATLGITFEKHAKTGFQILKSKQSVCRRFNIRGCFRVPQMHLLPQILRGQL